MRPITLHSQLQRLVAGCLFLFALGAVPAAWIASGLAAWSIEDPELWRLMAAALAAIGLPFAYAAEHAGRLSRSVASLERIGRSLVAGAPAAVPAACAPAELAALGESLAHAANTARQRELALRSADRVKDEFLATLAHELRNPLSAMSAAAYLLGKAAPGPLAQKSTQVIKRQVEQMSRLIEDLLDAARVTRGKLSLSRAPVNLAALVEKTVEELRLAGRLAAHELRTDLREAWVRADDARMQQVIANLVGNAVKYSPSGGRISVRLRREGDEAILRVLDNGIGMSPELAARVFDLFVQGRDAERRGGAGLGIGLTLVRHLVELHGGKVYAASGGPGQGSVFTVMIPAIEAQPQPEPPPPPAEAQSRHRILLVEDNADTRESLFAALAQDGHRVYEAADGRSGVLTAEALKPDVAVVDIGVPRLDGFRVATALREHPGRGRMVLIAMTGSERPDTLHRAREAGFDEYLVKPVAPDRLMRAVGAALARRGAGGAACAGH